MPTSENPDAFSMNEIHLLELERIEEEQACELRREAERRAREDEEAQQRRADAIGDERHAVEAPGRAEAKAPLERAPDAEDPAIPSLKSRFPIAIVTIGMLLAVAMGLAALLLQSQRRGGGASSSAAIPTQLTATPRAPALEVAAERSRLEARIRTLEDEVEAARQQAASAEAARAAEANHRARARPAKAEGAPPAPPESASHPAPNAAATSKIDTSVTDPLAGLDLE
jgi:hypothetical protein